MLHAYKTPPVLYRYFSTFDKSNWNFFSMTRDISDGKDYLGVNGIVTSHSIFENVFSPPTMCNIGYALTDTARPMSGWLDDIFVADRTITRFKSNFTPPTSYMAVDNGYYSVYLDKDMLLHPYL